MTLRTFRMAVAWVRRHKLKHERAGLERLLQDLYRQAYEDQLEREQQERFTQGVIHAEVKPDEAPG